MLLRHIVLVSLLLCAGTVRGQETSTYTVKSGDTLYRIATTHGLTVDELKRLNDLTDNIIKVGQVLSVKQSTRSEPPAEVMADPVEDLGAENGTTYVAQGGETLYSIAARIGSKAYIIYTMNGGIREPLVPGTALTVPEGSRETDPPLPPVYAAGEVQMFPATYGGRAMASGEPYDAAAYVVSHPTLPFDTILLVENPTSGAVTFARVADRGPLDADLMMDVSEAVAGHLGLQEGRRMVRIRVVE